ncbi:HDOD domain-containing protein [Vibrio salinus]|uniref:HDOD domain-containing protein n=1 Tax=Vibrio salinus TaxID=2899784 RepID=UPI003567A7DF
MEEVTLTVVCLDDDSFMLKAIGRVIRRLRPHWNIYMYEDSVQWFEKWRMEGNPNDHIDIFISDLIMPKKRGDALLEEIRLSYPQSIRVLLTGDTTSDLPKVAHDYAHFVIPKPFAQEHFEHLFVSAERLHKMPFTSECRKKLGNFTGLPVLPACVTKLKEALKDPDCDSQRIANVVSHEPVLVAKLLQIANSPFFGFRHSTESLTEAVTRLGASLIESVAISMLINVNEDNLTKAQHRNIADISLKSGAIARLLAKKLGRSSSEQDKVFIAALLTSVGALLMLGYGAKEKELGEFIKFQEGLFDYHIIAAYVLILWGYEIEVGEIILNQRNRAFDEENDIAFLASIVGIASQIAQCTSESDFQSLLEGLPDSISFLLLDNQSVLLSSQ